MALPGALDDFTALGFVVASRLGHFAQRCLDVVYVESTGTNNWAGALAKLRDDEADLALSDGVALLDALSQPAAERPAVVGLLQLFQKSTSVGVSINNVVTSFDKIAQGRCVRAVVWSSPHPSHV